MKIKKLLIIIPMLAATSSAAQSTCIWAKQIGGTDYNEGISMALDNIGNTYVTGTFTGTADFDPDTTATYNLTAAGSSTYYTDIFVMKLSASGDFLWAKGFGSVLTDKGTDLVISANGNIYITGSFTGTVDFNPDTLSTFNLTSNGSTYSDIFVLKLDSLGNFIWAKQFYGGIYHEEAIAIALDNFGNVYTTGYFGGTTDFDPDAGVYNLTTNGNVDGFISKLNANGDFIWAKQFGGTSTDKGTSLAIDGSGNVIVTGVFSGLVDFDPNVGTYNLYANPYASYLCKLDVSGNFIWAKKIESTDGTVFITSVGIDANNNVYTTGSFPGTTDFDPDVTAVFDLTALSSYADIFVSKLDSWGNFVWAKQLAGTSSHASNVIEVDNVGNCYIGGYFHGQVDFDPDVSAEYNLYASGYGFLCKLDSLGGFIWAKQIAEGGYSRVNSLVLDASQYVFSTGRFYNTVDFEPGAGNLNISALGGGDAFVSKIPQMSIQMNGTGCFGDTVQGAMGVVMEGIALYTYLWSPGGETSQSITGTVGEVDTLTVTDATGCSVSEAVTISLPSQITFTSATSSVSCNGGSDGVITVSATGGEGFLEFSMDLGVSYQLSNSWSNVAGGIHYLIVRDAIGCTSVTSAVNISEPTPVAASITHSEVSCYGFGDGTATVHANGGTPPYIYLWNYGSTSSMAVGLFKGYYAVNVTDVLNCLGAAAVNITEPDNLELSNTVLDASCGNADGIAEVSVLGGILPYTYIWSNGGNSSTELALVGGSYAVTITDNNGCQESSVVTIPVTAPVQEICIVTVDSSSIKNIIVWEKPMVTNIDSFRIYRDVIGVYKHVGSVPYTSLSFFEDNSVGVNPKITSYRYKITTLDACGNESALSDYHETIHVQIAKNGGIVDMSWDNYEGFGFGYYRILRDSIGQGIWETIDSVTNNNFTYTDIQPPTTNTIYAIEVVHNTGCTANKAKSYNSSKSNTTAVSGSNVSALSAITIVSNVTLGMCDGSAFVVANGGMQPYTYQWDGNALNQTSQTATSLCEGIYGVQVSDSVGSTVVVFALIGAPVGIQEIDIVSNLNLYPNPSFGQITLEVSAKAPGLVRTVIFDVLGNKVYHDNSFKPKTYSETIDLGDFSKGIYFVKVVSGQYSEQQKLVILK
ncbi:MAG: hypothetical protein COB85_03580 [Bacteroidetes bacterium]|nr:MAG: hypothetical protein COB85_03580 [Bacteroidota bacterium]